MKYLHGEFSFHSPHDNLNLNILITLVFNQYVSQNTDQNENVQNKNEKNITCID